MEIINANCASLCNYEVMEKLKKIKDGKKKYTGQLATITYETLRYLEDKPSAQQTSQTITECMKALKKFDLNKNEILTVINLLPTTALEIQLMIEESEDRLTEDQVQELLNIIVHYFPHIKKEENEEQETEET